MHDFLNAIRRDKLWETDGREISLGISKTNGLAFIVNGKCDGNAIDDAGTQVMAGLLGALFHPHPTRAAVIGLGTGSTAGWLAAIPTMERVDVLEIEPAITKFAVQCALVNHNALATPNVHLLYGDARELLLMSKQTYDIIASEPSNPYRAGIASLFTREYYQAIASKLNSGGFFTHFLRHAQLGLTASRRCAEECLRGTVRQRMVRLENSSDVHRRISSRLLWSRVVWPSRRISMPVPISPRSSRLTRAKRTRSRRACFGARNISWKPARWCSRPWRPFNRPVDTR